jgi:hypothetical protein
MGVAVLAICAVALVHGVWTTQGLSWPFDEDLYRDIAQARTMADGAWLADPFYRGESLWYNPLAPALIAVTAKLADIPANEASVRLGPWLGLAAPLSFAALAAAAIGRPGAVAALLLFVFVTPGRLPALLCATYSPWPFSAQVAQAPFYLGLRALVAAYSRPGFGRFVLVGALLGLAFLGHTAPALVLGAIAATLVLAAEGTMMRRAAWLGAILATAMLVASPFLWSILGRYHLRVVNPAPGIFVWTGTGIESLGGILRGALARPALLGLVLTGFFALLRREVGGTRARAAPVVMGSWALWGVCLLAYALAQPALQARGSKVPPLVPAFHFWMLLGALASLLAGGGLTWLGERAASLVTSAPQRRTTAAATATVAIGLGLALLSYPSWRMRDDFVEARRLAEFHGGWLDRMAMHRWVRAHTLADDVFLAEYDPGLRVVATAGRKLVAVEGDFSNPFVPWRHRAEAAARMLAALHPGGHEVFHPLAVEYRVGYVLVQRESSAKPFPEAPFLIRLFQKGDFAVYRTGCWTEPAGSLARN